MSSFFTERTAEYALVPVLQQHLLSTFAFAAPIYYWKTREGNSTAKRVHEHQHVKLLAMFARRPKLFEDEGTVYGKINHDLVNYARQAWAVGIPTIAGFPAVDSLFDLRPQAAVRWLSLDGLPEEGIEFKVDLRSEPTRPIEASHGWLQPLQLADVTALIMNAPTLPWQEAVRLLGELRIEGPLLRFNWFGSNYKPVYFLVSPNRVA